MQPLPTTPSKVDDGIERVKQSLSTKWGIRFPVRDATPSKRDMSLVEEKILVLIQFLYFREGALGHAIEQFEENAVHIVSQWKFKPHGEPDVLPSIAHSKSALKQDFLKKQHELPPQAVTELTESLKYFLSLVGDRVKAGEKFPTTLRNQGKISYQLHIYSLTEKAEIVSDNPIATSGVLPTKPDTVKRQSSLRQWLRSNSEPGPAKCIDPAAQHPSSDDYPDHELAELLVNADALENPLMMPHEAGYARRAGEPADIDHSSSSDAFETPPTTPPLRTESSTAPSRTRKRSCPDSMQAPPPRNVSRKISREEKAQEVSNSITPRGLD